MQSRSSIQQNWKFIQDLYLFSPSFTSFLLQKLSDLKVTSNFIFILHLFFQKTQKKWLEQNRYYFVRETTLIQNKFWTRNNNRTCRIIYPFSKKIIPKSTIFTFEYYRNRFKYPLSQIFFIIYTILKPKQIFPGLSQQMFTVIKKCQIRIFSNEYVFSNSKQINLTDNFLIEYIQIRNDYFSLLKKHDRSFIWRQNRHIIQYYKCSLQRKEVYFYTNSKFLYNLILNLYKTSILKFTWFRQEFAHFKQSDHFFHYFKSLLRLKQPNGAKMGSRRRTNRRKN